MPLDARNRPRHRTFNRRDSHVTGNRRTSNRGPYAVAIDHLNAARTAEKQTRSKECRSSESHGDDGIERSPRAIAMKALKSRQPSVPGRLQFLLVRLDDLLGHVLRHFLVVVEDR